MQENILDYLANNLARNGFIKTGPHTLFLQNEVDTIFVYLTDQNMVIIHDGDNVIHNTETILFMVQWSDFDDEASFEAFCNRTLLQPILHRF